MFVLAVIELNQVVSCGSSLETVALGETML